MLLRRKLIVLIVLAALFVIGTLLLAGTPYLGWAGAQRRTLDEREDAARNRAYHFAYHVITWLGILLLLVLAAGNFVSINSGLAYVLLGYVFLMFTLPGAVLAWKDRPPQ